MAEAAYEPSARDVEAGATALVRWTNPAHSVREPTDTDRQRVRVILRAVALANDHGRAQPGASGPLTCRECGIEKGWPCSFLDPVHDGIHGETHSQVCAIDKAERAGLVVGLVPRKAEQETGRG